ncbi:hypothetical protein PtA15_9A162 [Puccinia triticina]|uniref:TPX2 central domain-containing protein n=1 Tax=Puccinia triticina TaxID=208348 RepID=A0ABY7CVM1_9BASI|nr:uncharacterized protein PtA15_9A162 [Puccinia triticina]WAQ88037.1 hypothetical protein PtA15_9A162 [Puccinia triticina]WAR60233.1 hypothetical protein PtB15_9B170 [Puccinia triticina]
MLCLGRPQQLPTLAWYQLSIDRVLHPISHPMTAMKRRLCSMDDESFDSFKRRHIEQAKSETNSAALGPLKENPIGLNGSSATTLDKKGCRARFSSNFEFEGQLEEAFRVIQPNKPEPEKKSISPSHRELELTISDGIRSPVLPNTVASTGGHRIPFTKQCRSVKPKLPGRENFKNARNKPESSRFRKPKRSPRDINQFPLWNDIFQMKEKGRWKSPRSRTIRPPPPQLIRQIDDECTKPSAKKPKSLIPLSSLLISAKDYYELSILTPVGLQRDEKYNWGHLKKNAQIRNNLMRQKIRHRVLEMSSQAPAPSTEVLERRFRANRESEKLRSQRRPSCNFKSNPYKNLAEKHHGAGRLSHLTPCTGTSNPNEHMLNNRHTNFSTRAQIPTISKYFPPPSKNNLSFPVRSFPDEPHDPVSTSPPIEGNAGPDSRIENSTRSGEAIQDTLDDLSRHEIKACANPPAPLRFSEIKHYPKKITVAIDPESQRQSRVTRDQKIYRSSKYADPNPKTPLVLHSDTNSDDPQQEGKGVSEVARSHKAIDSNRGTSALDDVIPLAIPSRDEGRNEEAIQQEPACCRSSQVGQLNENNPERESLLQRSTGVHLEEGRKNNHDRPDPPRSSGVKSAGEFEKSNADMKASKVNTVEPDLSDFEPIPSDGFVPLNFEDSNSLKSSNKCQILPLIGENKIGSRELDEESFDTDYTAESWPGFPCFDEGIKKASSFSNNSSDSLWGDRDVLTGNPKFEGPPCSQVRSSRGHKTVPVVKQDSRTNKIQIECCAFQNPCRRRRIDFMPSYFSTRPPPFRVNDTLYP